MLSSHSRVIVCENNATRAELYAHWLDRFDVSLALTPTQALDEVDESVAVVVLDEDFGDGAAESVLALARSRAPESRILTTTETRGKVFPSLDVDNHLAKPVFEDELNDRVERLARQSLYSVALRHYYQFTAELTAIELGARERSPPAGYRERLEERVQQLKGLLAEISAGMDREDVRTVLDDLTDGVSLPSESRTIDSKYVPGKCPKCDATWDGDSPESAGDGPVGLGSFVWRCGDCGHVQLHASPNDGQLAPFL